MTAVVANAFGGSQLASFAMLVVSVAVTIYLLYWFAHTRLLAADLNRIEQLRHEGLLKPMARPDEDFRTLAKALDEVAPAVYVRQEIWVRCYYYVLRFSNLLIGYSKPIEDEMRRLVAYQTNYYAQVKERLAQLE